ncbi:hypothetical protein ABIB95_009361, partial [Bradyrhizobium sp. LA2.1]
MRSIQRAAEGDIASLVDGPMNANSATKPRMISIKNHAKSGPVGVLKPRCTMVTDRTKALTTPHRIKPTSTSRQAAWRPNPGRRSTYRRGDSVQTNGTGSPVKGYSLTIPITDTSRAPESTVIDETYKIAITRLGDRIRVGGMAEISGYTNDLVEARRLTLEYSVMDLFPGGDPKNASFWSGLRPMTPDGTPIIGGTRISNLFLNTGRGTLGWTMSCGSARVIADLVSGRRPDIEAADFGLGPVWIHLEFITAAVRWIIASKLRSVLSARMA